MILLNSMQKYNKYSALSESAVDVSLLRNVMSQLGITPTGSYMSKSLSFINRIDVYVERFPEVEYLIDMIASSIIYTSSSNTKKVQVMLNGEYEVETDTTDTTAGSDDYYVPNVEVNDVVINQNTVMVDSF